MSVVQLTRQGYFDRALLGFTISLYEWEPTVATLWKTVKGMCPCCHASVRYFIGVGAEFMAENPQYVSPNNSMDFLSDNGGETYNLCHCRWSVFRPPRAIPNNILDWSNFEIADMDFWRSEAYSKFFEFLESKGGFYYEVCALLERQLWR